MPSEASIVASRSRKPPSSTSFAAFAIGRAARPPKLVGFMCRPSGTRIPSPITPTTSSNPQKLSHTRLTEPSDTRRSEEHTSELQSPCNLVCRLLLEKKKKKISRCNIQQTITIYTVTHTTVIHV